MLTLSETHQLCGLSENQGRRLSLYFNRLVTTATVEGNVLPREHEGELQMTNSARRVTPTILRLRRASHLYRMLLPTLAIIAGIMLIGPEHEMATQMAGVALVVGGVWDH